MCLHLPGKQTTELTSFSLPPDVLDFHAGPRLCDSVPPPPQAAGHRPGALPGPHRAPRPPDRAPARPSPRGGWAAGLGPDDGCAVRADGAGPAQDKQPVQSAAPPPRQLRCAARTAGGAALTGGRAPCAVLSQLRGPGLRLGPPFFSLLAAPPPRPQASPLPRPACPSSSPARTPAPPADPSP